MRLLGRDFIHLISRASKRANFRCCEGELDENIMASAVNSYELSNDDCLSPLCAQVLQWVKIPQMDGGLADLFSTYAIQ